MFDKMIPYEIVFELLEVSPNTSIVPVVLCLNMILEIPNVSVT